MFRSIQSKISSKIQLKLIIPILTLLIIGFFILAYLLSNRFETEIKNSVMATIAQNNSKIEQSLNLTNDLMMNHLKTSMKILKSEFLSLGNPSVGAEINLGNETVNDVKFGNSAQAFKYDVVDIIKNLNGGTATLFSRKYDKYYRISTNVTKDNGERAVGTILDPKGKAIVEIQKGKSFYGIVDILGQLYLTGYEPIFDEGGQVIGIWYVGFKIETLSQLAQSISDSRILENGFVAVFDMNKKPLFYSKHISFEKLKEIFGEGADLSQEEWKVSKTVFAPWNFTIVSATYLNDINKQTIKIRLFILLFSIVILIGLLTCIVILLKKIIIKKLMYLTNTAYKLSLGDTDIFMESNTRDEIAVLESAFNEIAQNLKIKANVAEKLAQGNFDVVVEEKSDIDILTKSMKKMITNIHNLVKEVKSLNKAAIDGNLSLRGNTESFAGEYKEIVLGMNNTLDSILEPINEGIDVLEIIGKGDLTAQVISDYRGDHEKIKQSINSVSHSLRMALQEVSKAVNATASAANQISSSTEEMAAGSQEQSAQTTEIAGAVEEMSKTITETTRNASMAADNAKSAGHKAVEGGKVVSLTIDGMNKISEVVAKSAHTIFTLGKNSDKIGEIIQVIDDIADQTNLLALNAAIEAARAGEQGRGFAVVADEVRKLAERTTKATKEIADMIKQIQKDTNDAVNSMEKGTAEVTNGKKLVNQAGSVLDEIIKSTEKVSDIIVQVAAASEEQTAASEEISKNIEGISNVTNETSVGIQQIAKAAEDLNRLTINLQDLVGKFKIDNSSENKSRRLSSRN